MITVVMVERANRGGTSVKRVDALARKNSARQREAEQIGLLNWLLAFQHESDPIRPLRAVQPGDEIRTVRGATIPISQAVRDALRNQPLQRVHEHLLKLHGANAGGVLATGPAGRISHRGAQRFHAWWRDVCQRVLNAAAGERIDDIRLPAVGQVLRVHGGGRVERAYVARWPHTLKLQAVALLEQFRDRVATCPASTDRGQGRCGRPFVRVRRQRHCSVTCAQRERSRRWYRDNRKKT